MSAESVSGEDRAAPDGTTEPLFSRLAARLLPAPDYCGDIARRRVFPFVRLVCVGERRYVEVTLLGVFSRV